MASLADSLVSSSARRLGMRVRPDLSIKRHRYLGRSYWVVKEPVSLSYFRFQEEEFAILQMLDGETSLDDLKDRFEAEFPPQKITIEELQQFIVTLHRRGLVITDTPGQGAQLKKRRDERRNQELLQRFTNVLSIRFRGIDPDRILTWLHARVQFMFRTPAVVICVLLALSALTLVTVQLDEFRAKLPGFHDFFTLQNAIWIGITLGVTKVIHEFGHGLTCKHFGGECHEMGVMLLVLTPCLYCNVSDSWMLPSKWQRAMIGAAGMYVEVIIASICTFLWWYSKPGLLNQLCLSTMFVCSVSTIMFNGNPLLRYDGYYILSDLLEIPNLRQKASEILNRKLGEWCLGIEQPENPFLPDRHQTLFAIYSIAAVVYSWVVVLSILWFLQKMLQPYHLQSIGKIIAAMSMYGLFVQPLWKLFKFMRLPGRTDQVKKLRLFATVCVASAAIAVFFLVPLPHREYCTLQIEPHDAASVRVVVPGRVEEIHVKPGQYVEAGTLLLRLSNPDLELTIAEIEGRLAVYRTQADGLTRQSFSDDTAALQLASVRENIAAADEALRQKQIDQSRLDILAPVAGVVMPPPEEPRKPVNADGQLPRWSGTPLEERNLGAYLDQSTQICMIGDPANMQADLVLDQSQVDFVATGQTVDIKLDHLPLDLLRGPIAIIALEDMKVTPRNLSNKSGGELASKTDEAGVERPWSPSYQVLVYPLEGPEDMLRTGLRGRAKIHARWQTAAQRTWRLLGETFHFRM
jgi:putative peptide zinc metalloprotease protein